ncbi:hypothetical protein EJB05_28789, partial [Eragrostis curvula]
MAMKSDKVKLGTSGCYGQSEKEEKNRVASDETMKVAASGFLLEVSEQFRFDGTKEVNPTTHGGHLQKYRLPKLDYELFSKTLKYDQ